MNLVNNRLQSILDKRGLTQKDLAKMTGLYQSDISEIMAGKKQRMTLVTAAKISTALENSVEHIWPGLFT